MSNPYSRPPKGFFNQSGLKSDLDFGKLKREINQDLAEQYDYLQSKLQAQTSAHVAQEIKHIVEEGFDSFSFSNSIERFTDTMLSSIGDSVEDFSQGLQQRIVQNMDETLAKAHNFDKPYSEVKAEKMRQEAAQEEAKRRKQEAMRRKVEEHRKERAQQPANLKTDSSQSAQANESSTIPQNNSSEPYPQADSSHGHSIWVEDTTISEPISSKSTKAESSTSTQAKNSTTTSKSNSNLPNAKSPSLEEEQERELSYEESIEMRDILSQIDSQMPSQDEEDEIIDFAKLVEQVKKEEQEATSAMTSDYKDQIQTKTIPKGVSAAQGGFMQGAIPMGFNSIGMGVNSSFIPQGGKASVSWLEADYEDSDDDESELELSDMPSSYSDHTLKSSSVLESDLDLDAELARCENPQAYMQQLEQEAQAAYQEYLQQRRQQQTNTVETAIKDSTTSATPDNSANSVHPAPYADSSSTVKASLKQSMTQASLEDAKSNSKAKDKDDALEEKMLQAALGEEISHKTKPEIAQVLAKLEAEAQEIYKEQIALQGIRPKP